MAARPSKRKPIGRTENMRRIKAKDTGPELAVRRIVRELGYTGYRLHRRDIPGRPDLAFIGRRKAIFVHGCFWHGHDCGEGRRKPKSNLEYWLPKISRNQERDAEHLAALASTGWKVLTIWDCELKFSAELKARLIVFLSGS